MKKHGRGGDETPEISSEGIKPAKSKRKRAAAIIVSVILSVGILSGAGLWFISRGQAGGDNVVGGTSDTKKVVGMYGSTSSYLHYPIDDELDVTTVDEYMELDRTVHYKENGESLTAETVARQTGAKLYTLTMGMGEGEMGCTDAIYRNINTIREALG